MIESINELTDTLKETLLPENVGSNIAESERILSLASGSFVFLKGIGNLFSHPTLALAELVIGGALVYRGITGTCPVIQMIESQPVNSASDSILVATTNY